MSLKFIGYVYLITELQKYWNVNKGVEDDEEGQGISNRWMC